MLEPLQLSLPVAGQSLPTLKDFVVGGNRLVWSSLSQHQQGLYYLWGETGVGKSHLLQALCGQRQFAGQPALYLSLALPGLSPELLDGLDHYPWVVWDGLEAVVGQTAWEEALFHAYNRLQQAGAALLVAARQPPLELGIQLPDLRSRLNSNLCFQLLALDEAGQLQVLKQQALQRGLELSDEVGQFLLRRCPRRLADLVALLVQLDQASLAHQRRLTIPFVKQVLAL